MHGWACRGVLALAVALTAACSSGPSAPDESGYVEKLAAARALKDRAFQEDPESPIPDDKKDELLPLRYFPIHPEYSIPASLKTSSEQPVFDMPTSTGTLRKYRRVGVVEFTLQGQPMTLGAFVEDGQPVDTLFVPFADLTTGGETYSAGRYLELHRQTSGVYTLDFNTAYNPYCAYNSRYECPYPPSSNRLKVAIRAGEKAPGA